MNLMSETRNNVTNELAGLNSWSPHVNNSNS